MAKTPQRNVNLAEKYNRLALHLLECSIALLEPTATEPIPQRVLGALDDEMFNAMTATREYNRKVNPVELVGQRG